MSRLLSLAAVLLTLNPAAAAAQGRVLFTHRADEPAREGLEQAIRIQLAGVAEVERWDPLEAESLSDRLDAATGHVREHAANLAVWVEGPEAPAELVLYVVGQRPGRAVVQVERLSGPETPDLHRALALKVREIWDAIAAHGSTMAEAVAPEVEPGSNGETEADGGTQVETEREVMVPPAAAPPPEVSEDAALPPVRAAVEAGLRLGSSTGNVQWQVGGSIGAGVLVELAPWALSVAVYARLPTGYAVENQLLGRVDIEETDFALALHGGRDIGIVRFGAELAAGLRVLAASGQTAAGAPGQATQVIATVGLGLDARFRLERGVQLRLSVGGELFTNRQRFSLNDMTVADLGQARFVADLSVVFSRF